MNQSTKQLLRVLDRIDRIKQARKNKKENLSKELSFLHTKYEAYKASQTDEVPWCS